jgi:putative hydrolase of HD superfamily
MLHRVRRRLQLNAEEIIEVCLKSESLKRIPRTGWILAGASPSEVESVASHSWGTAIFALFLAHNVKSEGMSVDIEKLLTMAVLHDLPEAIVSDIPHRAVELGGAAMKSAKKETERNAMRQMLGTAGTLGESLTKRWEELEESRTIEARIVIAADRLDMLAHAISLETSGFPPQNLDGFFEHAKVDIYGLHLDIAESLFQRLNGIHKSRMRDSSPRD